MSINSTYILGIAVGLAMDACAVAIATSVMLREVSPRQVFRFGWHFGLFQAMMPVLGWFAGKTVASHIAQWDHWVAFLLLSGIGIKAIVEALRGDDDANNERSDPTKGMKMVALSIATSIDACAVGLSFAMLHVSIWYPAAVIGVVTGALTTLCMVFGARIGARFGQRMEIVGGLVLVGIGVKILLSHTA